MLVNDCRSSSYPRFLSSTYFVVLLAGIPVPDFRYVTLSRALPPDLNADPEFG